MKALPPVHLKVDAPGHPEFSYLELLSLYTSRYECDVYSDISELPKGAKTFYCVYGCFREGAERGQVAPLEDFSSQAAAVRYINKRIKDGD